MIGMDREKWQMIDIFKMIYPLYSTGLLYRAPELLRLADPPLQGSQKGDIYSFGILLYAIHGRQGPFGFIPLGAHEILRKVSEYAHPQPPFRSVD